MAMATQAFATATDIQQKYMDAMTEASNYSASPSAVRQALDDITKRLDALESSSKPDDSGKSELQQAVDDLKSQVEELKSTVEELKSKVNG